MRKNICAVILIAACLFFAPEKSSAEDSSEVRLLNDLLGHVYVTEKICGDILWALDYIDRFDRERNWENLQLARAAVFIAKSDIAKTVHPKQETTAEDYRKFMSRKIDVSFLEVMHSEFQAAKTTLLNACVLLNNYVMSEVFLKDGWKMAMRKAANDRNFADIEIQCLADMADYALTGLNDEEITRKFNALLEKHCPKTRAKQRKKPESLKKIEAHIQVLERELKDNLAESSRIIGEATHSYNVMKDAVEKEDRETIRKNIMEISGLPLSVPSPSWLLKLELHCFLEKNDGVEILAARSKLEGRPLKYIMQAVGISLEQVKAWQDELKSLGLSPKWSGEKDGKYYMLYQSGRIKFNVVWDNNKVNVLMGENPVCFIPILYMSVMNNR